MARRPDVADAGPAQTAEPETPGPPRQAGTDELRPRGRHVLPAGRGPAQADTLMLGHCDHSWLMLSSDRAGLHAARSHLVRGHLFTCASNTASACSTASLSTALFGGHMRYVALRNVVNGVVHINASHCPLGLDSSSLTAQAFTNR